MDFHWVIQLQSIVDSNPSSYGPPPMSANGISSQIESQREAQRNAEKQRAEVKEKGRKRNVMPTQFSKKYIKQNVAKWKAEVQANPISEYGPPPSASANGMSSEILKCFYFECH